MPQPTPDRILDCAHALLATHGYNGFSYADVARRVPLSKPAVHHHFPAKSDLGVAVVRRYRARAFDLLDGASRGRASGRARLAAYIGYWRDCVTAQESPFCVCALLAAEMPSLPAPVRAEVAGHFRALQAWLADAIRAGFGDGSLAEKAAQHRDADALAAELMALVHGAMLSARAMDDPGVFDRIAAGTLRGLA